MIKYRGCEQLQSLAPGPARTRRDLCATSRGEKAATAVATSVPRQSDLAANVAAWGRRGEKARASPAAPVVATAFHANPITPPPSRSLGDDAGAVTA
jgi:hypothetical protein